MNQKIKISQLPAKGANLAANDLLEIAEFTGTGYVSKSVTGQEIIDAAAGSGVTDVTATAPLISTGGSTPDISMPAADAGNDGFLSATDWNTFNNKQDALTLTTTGTSGAATLVGSTLNIPQYSGGSGLKGVHAIRTLQSGQKILAGITALGLSGTNTTVNRLYSAPFIPNQNITTADLYMNVTSTTGGNARILIYSDLNGLPDQKLYESATLDCSTTGIKTATTTFNFVAGTTYWLCFHTSASFTASFIQAGACIPLSITGAANPNCSVFVAATFGSAPNPFGTPSFTNSPAPFIGITAV